MLQGRSSVRCTKRAQCKTGKRYGLMGQQRVKTLIKLKKGVIIEQTFWYNIFGSICKTIIELNFGTETRHMCGRYYIDRDVEKEIYRIAQEIDENMRIERTGDIYPSQEAPVLYGRRNRLCGGTMRWGLTGKEGKLLINARAETALARPAFAGSVRQRRCVIPARHFYEWDRDKQKVTFCRRAEDTLYLAGFYRGEEDGPHFIILTTAANESVRPVHQRMPLILDEEEIRWWIGDDSRVNGFLNKSSPVLERRQNYEQMRLF